MSRLLNLCEEVAGMAPSGVEAQALVRVTRKSLTRFANSFIHQNVAEDSSVLTLDLASEGRTARTATTLTDPASLDRLVGSALSALELSPVDEDWTGFAPASEIPDVGHHDPATASAEPEERAAVVAEFIGAGSGLSAAGYCETREEVVAVANHRGLRYEGKATAAVLDGIHQTATSAGKAHRAGQSLASLDGRLAGVSLERFFRFGKSCQS